MRLKLEKITAMGPELSLDGGGDNAIVIRCDDEQESLRMILRAVNMFPALVGALSPFRTSEMGGLLVDMIDMREKNGEDLQKRLAHLFHMIDAILDAAERDDADEPQPSNA